MTKESRKLGCSFLFEVLPWQATRSVALDWNGGRLASINRSVDGGPRRVQLVLFCFDSMRSRQRENF